jgi:molybdopterin synthase sulfur carrier subunit
MSIEVRLFAKFREVVGSARIEMEAEPGLTVGAVWERLVAQHPDLASGRPSAALNASYTGPEAGLADGDALAFLPPVSGG